MKLIKRDKSFDIAKGIGMLAVILGHLSLPVWLSKFIFSFHMPLFFLINGYFFKPESIETFTKKKLRTLIFPYILTCLMVMLSSVFWNVLRQMSIPEIMADAGSWFWASVYGSGTITEFCRWHFRIIGAIWFLLAMFWADIIFDIILLKTKHAYGSWPLLLSDTSPQHGPGCLSAFRPGLLQCFSYGSDIRQGRRIC